MQLTEREKELLKGMIDRGEPLPPRYKLALFADAPEVELIWQGKTSEVTNVVLPFQSIEQIDEPRKEGLAEQVGGGAGLFSVDQETGRQAGGWSNKLIWGDNKLILSSLKNGSMRRAIQEAGGLKLVYIDPPFDVGSDFSVTLDVGAESLVKEASVIEEVAYRDTWGRGIDSYLSMMYERLKLIHALLAEDGCIYVHCDWRVNSAIRLLLNDVFGADRFVAEIVWYYTNKYGANSAAFDSFHNDIYCYSKSDRFVYNPISVPVKERRKQPFRKWNKELGKNEWQRDAEGNYIYVDSSEKELADVWEIPVINPMAHERLGYDTQKPEALLSTVIRASSNPGDLIADFFCGSGTTLAVAENLGRKWIGCDLGRFAIHTTRKRLIGAQRALKANGQPYRSFEILNLGKYERQFFVGIDPTLPENQRRAQAVKREGEYLDLVLRAYKGERVQQMPPFHGRRGATLVVVGPIDSPVTQSQVAEIVSACATHRISKVDVLGFEFEMGLVPQAQDDARAKGVSLALKYIPKDVFDKRAVEKGQVKFYDVAFVEIKPMVAGLKLRIKLDDFGVFYEQDRSADLAEDLKPGGSKVTVEGGQVVKVTKDKTGVISKERLTKKWADWIDYWAVDFDYENRKEIVRFEEDGLNGDKVEVERWTGGYIFENEWQSFRTRKDRTLELTSVAHEYPKKGKYKVAVKVIDIFGNDTTKVVGVKI